MRVLVIEDDRKIGSFVVTAMKQAGYVVDHAAEGPSGLELALSTSYDAAVVDVMLPGLGGLEVISEMRRRKLRTPVIILSAKRSVDDRVKGLQEGGDDYLTKPFSITELLARVQALIRRTSDAGEEMQLAVGELSLDIRTREVTRGGEAIELQPREYTLLEYLMRNAGRPVSKAMILEHVWDYSFDPGTNVVDVLVCRLRNKIDRDYPARMIHTVRGVGYVVRDN
jgi:two-component system OmpR family response regulator